VISSIHGSRIFRCSTRAELTANRSSLIHSGLPKPSHKMPKRRSVPPPKSISPSEVLKDLYGTTDASLLLRRWLQNGKDRGDSRCEVPQRPVSRFPEMRTDSAIFESVATWQSLRQTSRCCPSPVFALPRSAAMMLFAVYSPVVRSVTAQPTLTGGPSRVPVMCISPISLRFH
jgi:hypothetical protein